MFENEQFLVDDSANLRSRIPNLLSDFLNSSVPIRFTSIENHPSDVISITHDNFMPLDGLHHHHVT